MTENLHPNLATLDPTLQAGAVQQRQYEAIKQQYGVEEVVVPGGQTKGAELSLLDPLAEVQTDQGSEVMLALLNTGSDIQWQVWAQRTPEGQLDKSKVWITADTYNPQTDNNQQHAGFLIQAGYAGPVIGRNYSHGLPINAGVSRHHMSVGLTNEGTLQVTDHNATNGTSIVSRTAPPAEIAPQPTVSDELEDTLIPERKPGPQAKERFSSVNDDPAFKDMVSPFSQARKALRASHDEKSAVLAGRIRHLEATNPSSHELGNTKEQVRQLEVDYQSRDQEIRDQLQAAVKPYLRQRIAFFYGDGGKAGYTLPHMLQVDRNQRGGRDLLANGKKIGHYLPSHTPGREGSFVIQSINLGQISLGNRSRMRDWAGSGSKKTNELTRGNSSSTEHIVELASAMVAGNMREETHPIIIERDDTAEYDLPKELQGKIPFYKVKIGFHRVAAQRLLDGLNSRVSFDQDATK